MATTIKWETAENMMNIVAFSACRAYAVRKENIDIEAIQQYARKIFEEYCEAMDITNVEEPEVEVEVEEDGEAEMESLVYDVDGQRGISIDDARLLMKCVAKVMRAQFGYLPDEVVEILIRQETLRIAAEWNIEVVDVSEDE